MNCSKNKAQCGSEEGLEVQVHISWSSHGCIITSMTARIKLMVCMLHFRKFKRQLCRAAYYGHYLVPFTLSKFACPLAGQIVEPKLGK